MPMVGWMREGDWEGFLEGTERVPDPRPRQPSFQCPFCNVVVQTRRELHAMSLRSHHVARPILLLAGREPTQTSIIRTTISAGDIYLGNVTAAEIAVDGSARTPIPTSRLTGARSGIKQGEVRSHL